MSATIRKLFGASGLFILLALSASYFGYRQSAAGTPSVDGALARQFAAEPGDGWMLAGGFLMLVALAVAFAGVMLWVQERRQGS